MSDFPPDSKLVGTRLARLPINDDRKAAIDMILLHYTGMESSDAALSLPMQRTQARVSSHYFVDEDGGIFQLVPEDRRARGMPACRRGLASPTSTPVPSASRSSIPATISAIRFSLCRSKP